VLLLACPLCTLSFPPLLRVPVLPLPPLLLLLLDLLLLQSSIRLPTLKVLSLQACRLTSVSPVRLSRLLLLLLL
jgi:hypothetical protein